VSENVVSNNAKNQMNDKLCLGLHSSKRVEIIPEESKEYSEKSVNISPAPENELNSSTSKVKSSGMMLKINQQSLDNQFYDYNLRPAEDENEDFNVGDADEDYDCKVPPMFLLDSQNSNKCLINGQGATS
jgi:hypothetical protein